MIVNSILVLMCEICVFWAFVITAFLLFGPKDVLITHYWHEKMNKKKLRKKRQKREQRESAIIKADLERGVAIPTLVTSKSMISASNIEELLEQGIAVNQTLSQEDTDNEKVGDHWLCNYRWLWFSIYQLMIALPISCVLVFITLPIAAASTGFVISTLLGIRFGILFVPQYVRAGITRFEKYAGFLAPGLQFRVPIFERVGRLIVLKNMDWGPGQEAPGDDASDEDEFRIDGATGGESNPSPGVFVVALHGTYKVKTSMNITLRVRRADRNSWFWWMFEFTNTREIGEVLAHTAQAIISTRAREIHDEPGDPTEPVKVQMEKKLVRFLNCVPEITGTILLALYELTRERLGGLLPISVTITSIDPPVEFTNLLLKLDTAKVDREVEELAGKGRADRWNAICEGVAKLAQDHSIPQEVVLRAIDRDTALAVAQQPGTLDTYLKALTAPLVAAMAQTKEKKGS